MSLEDILLNFFKAHPDEFPANTRLLAACSGGPDSVALLLALNAIRADYPLEVIVGHVNHGLRGRESDGDGEFVKRLAKNLGFKVVRKRVSVSTKTGGNLEEKARLKRYEGLVSLARAERCPFILTGHNLDDQVETILMKLFRGAGLSGISGMPTFRVWSGTPIRICRPLLGVSKAEIREYLARRKADFRTDRMNADPKFLRHWLRNKIVPEIEGRFPGFKNRLEHFAGIVREEESFWNKEVQKMKEVFIAQKTGDYLLEYEKFAQYSLPLQRRFLKQVIGPDLLSFDNLEALRKWMGSPPADGRIWQLRKGWFVERMSRSKGASSARLFWLGQKKEGGK